MPTETIIRTLKESKQENPKHILPRTVLKAVADEMLRLCCEAAPSLFKKAGPSCVRCGKCPEGKMTCGKYNEVTEFYRQMREDNANKSK